MKKILAILLVSFTLGAYAQTSKSIFTHKDIVAGQLNAEQNVRYQKLVDQEVYSSFHFVTTKLDTSNIDSTGKLPIILPSCFGRDLMFQINDIQLKDKENYSVRGNEYLPGRDLEGQDGYSYFTILKTSNEFIGHITVEGQSYELYDLTGGLQVICHTDMTKMPWDCNVANEDNNSTAVVVPGECTDNVIKILVLYTPAAEASEPNIQAKAQLAINDLSSTWSDSGVGTNVQLAACEPINFSSGPSPDNDDLPALKIHATALALRAQYQAEVVVMLVGSGTYGQTYGAADQLGASINNAFAVVDVAAATSGRHTFAHEVSHLFDARHQDDATQNNTHGRQFKTGAGPNGGGGTWRYTLMYRGGPLLTRLPRVSNPNDWFLGCATGTPFHNNAWEAVHPWQSIIAPYYNDMNHPTVSLVRINCDNYSMYWHGKVQNFCPVPYNGDYTFKWYRVTLLQAFAALFGIPYQPTYIVTGNDQWLHVPDPYTYVYCDVYDVNNTLVGSYGKFIYGIDQNGNCIGYKGANPNATVGEDEVAAENKNIEVFPNPNTGGTFSVKILQNSDDKAEITIFDIAGREVAAKKQYELAEKDSEIKIKPATMLAPGVYFVNIKTKTINEMKRVIVE